jgi:epoxyqueuosine reductase
LHRANICTMSANDTALAQSISQKALELGFGAVGFSKAGPLTDDALRLTDWLNNGYHADMAYMANHFDKRVDPSQLVEGATTVISLLFNYFPSQKPLHNDSPIVARYAYGLDYHDVLKQKLQQLFDFIKAEHYPLLEGRVFTDSAPILERAWAAKAGLGWIGKNANLIHPKLGSYVFIAELIVNLPFNEASSPINDYCGGCTKCIDACPTKAIIGPKTIDSNRCISYLTIENKGDIDTKFEGLLDNRVFGCDICQEVCPWNRKVHPHSEPLFEPKPELIQMAMVDWQNLSQEGFSELFKGSAIKRAKHKGVMRNVAFITSNNTLSTD